MNKYIVSYSPFSLRLYLWMRNNSVIFSLFGFYLNSIY